MWSDDNLILTFDQSRSIFTSQDVPRRSQRQTSPPQRRRCQGPSVRVRRPRTRPRAGRMRCYSLRFRKIAPPTSSSDRERSWSSRFSKNEKTFKNSILSYFMHVTFAHLKKII